GTSAHGGDSLSGQTGSVTHNLGKPVTTTARPVCHARFADSVSCVLGPHAHRLGLTLETRSPPTEDGADRGAAGAYRHLREPQPHHFSVGVRRDPRNRNRSVRRNASRLGRPGAHPAVA